MLILDRYPSLGKFCDTRRSNKSTRESRCIFEDTGYPKLRRRNNKRNSDKNWAISFFRGSSNSI